MSNTITNNPESTASEYQGWTNHETWCVALTFNNTQKMQDDVLSIVKNHDSIVNVEYWLKKYAITHADEIHKMADWVWPESRLEMIEALKRVNWREIRETLQEKLK